jgi:hypothetical protein
MMIKEYVTDLASQMGIKLEKIVVTEGRSLGCMDAHLLSLCAKDKLVSEFIHQSDIDNLKNCITSDLLEIKIRSALERLKMQLAP